MDRRELPTEPELNLGAPRREEALRAWAAGHPEVPEPLRRLLEGVVLGLGGAALAAHLGVPEDGVALFERAFFERVGRPVYSVAAEILDAASKG